MLKDRLIVKKDCECCCTQGSDDDPVRDYSEVGGLIFGNVPIIFIKDSCLDLLINEFGEPYDEQNTLDEVSDIFNVSDENPLSLL